MPRITLVVAVLITVAEFFLPWPLSGVVGFLYVFAAIPQLVDLYWPRKVKVIE